jgi:photosystem II stability/assembly factor-like uncharacterized protein
MLITRFLPIMVLWCCLSPITKGQQIDMAKKNNYAIDKPSMESPIWQPLNTTISGRMTDVEMPLSDTLTLYAGAASGGVWRSQDGGKQWQPIFDQQPCAAIGDIAIAPTNSQIIYAGTGEANGGGGSITYDGCGIFKSENGGDNWQYAGLAASGSIGRIAIHPRNANIVYTAAMGKLFANNAERGVFKSTDGGQTWVHSLYLNDSTGCIDLAIHPLHPDTVFAAMWQRTRRPNERQYGGEASGLFRSTNGGITWEKLSKGLPQKRIGRIGIAVANSKPNRIYAVFIDEYGDFMGIFRSDDVGNNWKTVRNNEQMSQANGYSWWFGNLTVAPNDEDQLYMPLLDIWQSDNAGNKWTNISENLIHYDQHALFIHPLNPQYLVAANDGGIYISRTSGKTWQKTPNLPTAQYYCIAQEQKNNKAILYGGMQDNGVVQINLSNIWNMDSLNKTVAANKDKKKTLFSQFKDRLNFTDKYIAEHGDGLYLCMGKSSPYRRFYAFQYGDLYSQLDTSAWEEASKGIYKSDRCAWKMPIIYSPSHQTFLCATQSLYRWNENKKAWQPWGNRADFSDGGDGYNFHYGTVTSIAASETDTLHVYCATDDGNVWATHNSGKNFALINHNLPKRWVNDMVLYPNNMQRIYIAQSAYRQGKTDTTYIYSSDNGGQHWQSIAYNLPKGTTVNKLLWVEREMQGKILLAATDKGIWALPEKSRQWHYFSQNIPPTPITDLQYDPTHKMAFAATYGRGIYWTKW